MGMWIMAAMQFALHFVRGRKKLLEALGCYGIRNRGDAPKDGKDADVGLVDHMEPGTCFKSTDRGVESPTPLAAAVERLAGACGASVDPSTGPVELPQDPEVGAKRSRDFRVEDLIAEVRPAGFEFEDQVAQGGGPSSSSSMILRQTFWGSPCESEEDHV